MEQYGGINRPKRPKRRKISHLIPEQVGIIRYDGVISHGEDLVVVISYGPTGSVDRSVGEAEALFMLEPLFYNLLLKESIRFQHLLSEVTKPNSRCLFPFDYLSRFIVTE